MEPQVVKKSEFMIAGIVGTGSTVTDIDIAGLWERFIAVQPDIKHQIEEKSYELHIEEETSPRMHFCLVGNEVKKNEALPIEIFLKVIPECIYALFTHHFSDGSYGAAFKAAYEWLESSKYEAAYPFDIQCYDDRFKGESFPRSVIEILIPILPRGD